MMRIRRPALFARFIREERGTVTILTAILAVVLIGFTGLAVDIGSVVYWRHRLQAATDFAALAATFDTSRAAAIATESLQADGPEGAALEETEVGSYVDDPSLSQSARFSAAANGDAVHLVTQYAVPIHFIRVFTGSATMPVRATATAYDLPLAGVAIGTEAANVNNVDLNSYLDAVSNSSAQLTPEEQAALNATQISIFRLFDQIAGRVGSRTMSMKSVMSSSVGLQTLAEAAAQAMTDQYPNPSSDVTTAIGALTRIAGQSDNSSPVQVSDIVTLGAHQNRAAENMISTRTDSLGVPGLSVLMDYLHSAKQDDLVSLNQAVTVPGVATIAVNAVLENGVVGSGTGEAATIGPVGSSVAGSRGRVQFTITLLQPLDINLGLIQLSLPMTIPLIADVGYGSATVSNISCGSDILDTTDVAVGAQAGAAHLYIGSVSPSELTDFLTPLAPQAAQIIDTSLTQVDAAGQENIAQSGEQTLHFSESDIMAGTVKTVDGTSSLGNSVSQLGSGVSVIVVNAPPGSNAIIASLVQTEISSVLTTLEPILSQILTSLGIKVGAIDVRATAARCGIPALVM